jgi:hypothetical protein
MLFQKCFFAIAFIINLFFTSACNLQVEANKAVDIIDVRNRKEPEANIASHKHNDVEVFRIIFMGECYKVRYYQNENGSLNHHEAYFMINENFDKASYRRLSDTSLAVRLFNSATEKEKKFELFGNGSTSGMRGL